MKSTPIRKSARGQECTLRLAPYCNGNPETVVLAHLPSPGHGMSLKSPDRFAVFACSACHDVADSRNPQAVRDLGWEEIYRCMLRALYETHGVLLQQGLMTIKGAA